MTRLALGLVTFWVSLSLVSCGSVGPTAIFGQTPADVVKASYMACNAGEYSKAEGYLSEDTKNLAHGPLGQLGGGIKGACDGSTRNGSIENVEIKSETIRGEGATVIADIHFKDKSVKRGDVTQLIKEKGSWKETEGGN